MTQTFTRSFTLLALLLITYVGCINAQPVGAPLGKGPWIIDNSEESTIRLSVISRTLDHPFGMVFLPNTGTTDNTLGDILISERTGKIRLFRNGQLLSIPVVDLTETFAMEQLFDLKMHPQFAENGLIYFSYIKTASNPDGSDSYWVTTALGRGQFNGESFLNLEDVFVAQAWSSNFGGASSRLHFMSDGTLLLGVSHRIDRRAPQSLDSHIGKVLRLNDDGTAPADNPFVGIVGALPEIYTLGNRSVMDFATHPVSGEVWELENGPQGGDEVNILKPSLNYGWPVATYGRDYDGTLFNPQPWVEGTELPEIFWVPSITVAGMSFYTGDKFPNWQGNLFVTSMITGRIPGTGHLQRIVFNENGEVRREYLLRDLKQRIRYVTQGPDGLIYLLTDHPDGVLLRMEPISMAETNLLSSDESSTQQTSVESALFADYDCRACHQMNNNLVGPSYTNIARRYTLTDANITLLAEKIMQGGGGIWGEVPMAPHSDLSLKIASEMVVQLLSIETE